MAVPGNSTFGGIRWPSTANWTPTTFAAALRQRLLSAASLSALTDVYDRGSKPNAVYPFLVVNVIGGSPEPNNGTDSYPEWVEVQFSVIDDDPDRGEGLRDAAWKVFAPNVTTDLTFDGGTDSGGRRPGRKWEIKQPGIGKSGQQAWAFMFSWSFYLTRGLT